MNSDSSVATNTFHLAGLYFCRSQYKRLQSQARRGIDCSNLDDFLDVEIEDIIGRADIRIVDNLLVRPSEVYTDLVGIRVKVLLVPCLNLSNSDKMIR